MNASVAIQVLPNVQDEEEVIRIVDEVIAYILLHAEYPQKTRIWRR